MTRGFSFQNITKNLDQAYKMDLDIWDCFGTSEKLNTEIKYRAVPLNLVKVHLHVNLGLVVQNLQRC